MTKNFHGQVVFNAKFCEKSKFDIENGLRQVLYPVLDEKPRWRQNYTKILENAVFWSFTTVF